MYYVRFNDDGHQEETVWSDSPVSDTGWYSVGKNIDGKFFKLTSSGNASAMTAAQYETFMSSLAKSSAEFNVRVERDILLQGSDWTQLPSSNLAEEKRVQWEAYRQELRDLPQTIREDLSYELPQPPQ